MNNYTFEQMTVGLTESFSVTVTEEMHNSFTELSSDRNPMHMDADYAKQRGFNDRIVYGMLSASFFSALAGMYLPGEHCLLLECSSSFHKPVYIGDTLTITGKVSEVTEATRTARIKAVITNQKGEKVVKGKITVGFTE